MRIGFNPNKDKILPKSDYIHHVIVPVYIPHQNDYFKDSFKILRYCLESLFKTCHPKTFISVVNNGSCTEVRDFLNSLLEKGNIQELIHSNNIGKLNAILKGLSGQKFNLVTITDADVLFLNGWQKNTYFVFEAFSKTGAVCPTPSSKVLKQHTFNILFDYFFSNKLRFTKTRNRKALLDFAESIGNPEFYNENQLAFNLTISNANTNAVIGAGHFVTTYRGAVFNKIKERYSNFNLGGDSESKFLDQPIADQGYWRLSTEDNFAYHMGNVAESWMLDKLNSIEDQSNIALEMPILKELHSSKILNFIKEKIFMRLINVKLLWSWFLQYKGLSKEASKNY
jgi:hypothetical protein